MATYHEIQTYVRQTYGFTPKTCWIAHVKELTGLQMREAPNRIGADRAYPCPPDRQEPIRKAFKHFGMLGEESPEVRLIRIAEAELPELQSYSVAEARRQLGQLAFPNIAESRVFYSPADKPLPAEVAPLSRQGDWLISFTSEFRKSLDGFDKKLKGRVLEAITDLGRDPLLQRSNTMKPLKGELAGKWRYRIGDYRLIYKPDNAEHTVYMLALRPRGSAYDD